jgi:hypothetical protein
MPVLPEPVVRLARSCRRRRAGAGSGSEPFPLAVAEAYHGGSSRPAAAGHPRDPLA